VLDEDELVLELEVIDGVDIEVGVMLTTLLPTKLNASIVLLPMVVNIAEAVHMHLQALDTRLGLFLQFPSHGGRATTAEEELLDAHEVMLEEELGVEEEDVVEARFPDR
jgi:hypothetical protein